MPNIQAAYIHVPFCRHRCGYCDFTLVAGRDDLIDRYSTCLQQEMAQTPPLFRSGLAKIETLFFGGGTPTHPGVAQLRRLFDITRKELPLSNNAEVSVEANPLDLTDEKIELLADCGVNRVSLGVQSFAADVLALLERDHRPHDIHDVMQRLRRTIDNVSLDLIFGVPGQSLASWRDTVRQAVDLAPRHISTYGLTWEEGTAFFTRKIRGVLQAVEDGLERDQYAMVQEELAAAGYEHYEISNFAQPGYRCRHNLVYWHGEEFLAYGPGAARYVSGRRETNVRSVLGWLKRIERGESPTAEREELDPPHRARELIYLGLRLTEGVDLAEFERRTGWNLREFAAAALRKTTSSGWIEATPTHVRLTREGRFIADRVVMEFL